VPRGDSFFIVWELFGVSRESLWFLLVGNIFSHSWSCKGSRKAFDIDPRW
jgi:hypothetical protein